MKKGSIDLNVKGVNLVNQKGYITEFASKTQINSLKSRVVEALKEGANNYIVKPFTPEAVKEKLGL
jgi:response regulator of citrate/malate metabolism